MALRAWGGEIRSGRGIGEYALTCAGLKPVKDTACLGRQD